jgi:hypothetical protein
VCEAAKATLEVEKGSLRSKLAECDADRQHMASALHEMRRNFQDFLRLKPSGPGAGGGSGALGGTSPPPPLVGGSHTHAHSHHVTSSQHFSSHLHHSTHHVLQHAASTPPPRTVPSHSATNSTATTPVGATAQGCGDAKTGTPDQLLKSA